MQENIRVGILSSLGGGGLGKVTRDLLEGLSRINDIQIGLYLLDRRQQYQIANNDKCIRQEYIPRIKSHLLSKVISLIELSIKKIPYDVIHCNYSANATFLKNKDNLILTMHGFPRPEIELNIFDKLAYQFEHLCTNHLSNRTKIITISQYCQDNIRRRYGLEPEVIYNGIDCNFYRPALDRKTLREQTGLANKKVILFVGNFHPMKDPLTLIKAYGQVTKKVTNAVLIMVGRGPLEERMRKLSLNYDRAIKFLSGITNEELLSLYQCADVFVLPSLGEPFGLVLAEAMACGCPSIANTSGASPELIKRSDLLAQPGDSGDLAERILYLLENPQFSAEVSAYLNNRANMLFSLDIMADRYYRLYHSVANH